MNIKEERKMLYFVVNGLVFRRRDEAVAYKKESK